MAGAVSQGRNASGTVYLVQTTDQARVLVGNLTKVFSHLTWMQNNQGWNGLGVGVFFPVKFFEAKWDEWKISVGSACKRPHFLPTMPTAYS